MNSLHLKRLILAAALIAVAAAIVPTTPAFGQMSQVDKDARKIFLDLMSPYCPGLSLYSCRSGNADILRNNIRERLAAGETREEIVESLVAEFGENILGAPPNKGFARAAWLGPIAMSLVGILIVVVALRRYARRGGRDDEPIDIDPAIRARLEQDF